ncbi:MalY/PatB family protein [Streptomyces sodiiphilus]
MTDPLPPDRNPLRLPLAELRRRTSVKWRTYPEDVLPMWVAEMDVLPAPPVRRALHEAVDLGDTGYPAGTGYARALDAFTRERWAWEVVPEHTAVVPDVMLGMVEVLKLVTGPGDAVVISPPLYPPIRQFVGHLGRRVLHAPLDSAGRLDPEAIEEAFRDAVAGDRPAAYVLCSPHNPTGTVHTAEELATVARLASRYGVRVVSDEIHAPLVLPGAVHLPYLSLPGTEDAFVLISASKAWNLAGLKAALVVAGPTAVADLARMPEEVSHGPSHLGVIAHTAAFLDGGPWLDDLRAALSQNRTLLSSLLATHLPEVRMRQVEGGYLAWLDCRDLGLGDNPAKTFLHRGRVALNPGHTFGPGGAGRVRFNFAASPDLVTEAVRRMAAAV